MGRTDWRTDWRTDGRTDGLMDWRTDGQTEVKQYTPPFLKRGYNNWLYVLSEFFKSKDHNIQKIIRTKQKFELDLELVMIKLYTNYQSISSSVMKKSVENTLNIG